MLSTRPGLKVLITVPDWLGGAHTVRWIFQHRWALRVLCFVRGVR